MLKRGTIVGISLLCALTVAAVAAQGAGAAGFTAFTCAETGFQSGVERFADAHCKIPNGSTGPFKHTAFAGKTTATWTNGFTSAETSSATFAELKTTVAGVAVTLTAEEVEAMSTVENKEVIGEMFAHFVGAFTYSKVTVSPKTCVIPGGTLVTSELTGISTTTGLKVTPAAGEVFAEFELTGASCPEALKTKYKIVGSLVATLVGATATTTDSGTTQQGTLRLGSGSGPKVGLEGAVTLHGPLNAIVVT